MTRNVRMSNPTHRYDTTGESGPTDKPTVQWSHEFDTDTQEIAIWDGQVYVTGEDGSILVFDTDRNPQWRFQIDGPVKSSPAVVDGTVYVGSSDGIREGTVCALDAANGTEQWYFQTDGQVQSSLAVVDDTVYVGDNEGGVYALDAASGTERWCFQTDGPVNSSPAVVDGTVYVGNRDDDVYALDTAFGDERWSFQTDVDVQSSPAVASGTVYVGSSSPLRSFDRHVYALDAASGTERWSLQIDGSVVSSPVVKDGTVYVAGEQTVYALSNSNTRSGETEIFNKCSACQTALNDYDDPQVCPSCGADLSDSGGDTQIYDPD